MRHLLSLILVLPLLAAQVYAQPEDGGTYKARTGADGVQRAEVVAGSYYFRPGHIIVKAGVPVELELRNEALIVPHDFIINAPEAGIEITEELTSKPVIVRFTPTEPGRYPFFCGKDFPFQKSHRAKGMEGVLEVVP